MSGLSPAESSFLAETHLVSILPRQTLPSLPLLSGPTPTLSPPHRVDVPLWLALLLRRQDRAQILPPPWLRADALEQVLEDENRLDGFVGYEGYRFYGEAEDSEQRRGGRGRAKEQQQRFGDKLHDGRGTYVRLAPPFTPDALLPADGAAHEPPGLPYHWLEIAHLLLEGAAQDIKDADTVRRLVRDLRETRAAKLRKGLDNLDGGREVTLNGVGGLEISENRAFVLGVVDGLRKIGASKEASRRERGVEAEVEDEDEDEDML